MNEHMGSTHVQKYYCKHCVNHLWIKIVLKQHRVLPKDENNTTISLSNITGVLGVGQTLDQVLSYTPTEPGTYTIEKFLWSDLSNPTALIDEKEMFTFIASDFGITISEP